MTSLPVPARRTAWRLLPLALALSVVAACTNNGSKLSRLAPDYLYERASKALRSGDYQESIRVYEALTARYPFTDQARQSRLDIIYAYYKNNEKESAIDAAETFIRENPAHPRVDYAWYLKGLVDFERTPNKVERFAGIDLSGRPPTSARKSFLAFKVVVEQYPKSAYAADARRRMVYLRNRLADFEMQVARYYLKRSAWVAAAQRAQVSIEQYDGAPSTREALQILVECYQKLGYTELAANTQKVYNENFPAGSTDGTANSSRWWKVWQKKSS